MADDQKHSRQPDHHDDGWAAQKRKNDAFKEFEIASEAAALRKEQEWQRRFLTPEARADADQHERMAEAARLDNDEKLKKRLEHIAEGWDRSRPQPPEFARHLNEMKARAYRTWGTEKATIDHLLESALTRTENEHKTLAHKIGMPPPAKALDPLIADHRSDHKRSWDDAGQRPQQQPRRSAVLKFNDGSRGQSL